MVYTTQMNCTAYCVQDTSPMTASGRSAYLPMGCAAGPDIPFGSVIVVNDGPWRGRYFVDDRGGAIREGCVDLRLRDHETCVQFGRRTLTVEVRIYDRGEYAPAARGIDERKSISVGVQQVGGEAHAETSLDAPPQESLAHYADPAICQTATSRRAPGWVLTLLLSVTFATFCRVLGAAIIGRLGI